MAREMNDEGHTVRISIWLKSNVFDIFHEHSPSVEMYFAHFISEITCMKELDNFELDKVYWVYAQLERMQT